MVSPALAADTVKLEIAAKPAAVSTLAFTDEQGNAKPFNPKPYKLSVIHFWAIWCASCIEELPQVDKAAKTYAAKGMQVIAVSMDDKNSMPKIKKFYGEHQITSLSTYFDPNNASFQSTHLAGLPGTLFLDKDGKEIAHAEGPLDWSSPEVTAFIESHLK